MKSMYRFFLLVLHCYAKQNILSAAFVYINNVHVVRRISVYDIRPHEHSKIIKSKQKLDSYSSSSSPPYQSSSILTLFAQKSKNVPDQRPLPRRNLKRKRSRRDNGKNRRRNIQDIQEIDDFPWDTAEIRPFLKYRMKETGMDYWMDEEELAKSLELEKAIKNRKVRNTL